MEIKTKDFTILNFLLKNSRISIRKISEGMGLSLNSVYDRIKRMEVAGLIKSYPTLIDSKYLRHGMLCMLIIEADNMPEGIVDKYYVNSVIELTSNKFLIELNLSNIYQLNSIKMGLKGVGKIIKKYYIKDCIQRNAFVF